MASAHNRRSIAKAAAAAGALSANVPAVVPAAGTSYTSPMIAGSFMDGHDGGPRASFANYRLGYNPMSPISITMGTVPNRDANLAAAVASDLSLSNPTLATIVDTLCASAVGTGMTLSSKPDCEALGIAPEQAEAISHHIETAFDEWANNPLHCDHTGRRTLHELADTAFRVAMLTGEILTVYGWKRHRGSRWASKVNLLSPGQLDQTVSRIEEGRNVMQGVAFDNAGVVVGYYIRSAPLGSLNVNAMPKYMPERTAWGRRVVLHAFECKDPRQLRGVSPIMAALAPAQDRNWLGEKVLGAAALQASFAMTIESEDRPENIANSLSVDNDMSGMARWTQDRHDFYSSAKVDFSTAKVNFLARGDRLRMNQPASPNQTFQDFDKGLTRQSARAAGATYEDISGDYSETNFAASRMAQYIPGLLTAKRRKMFVEAFYRAAFEVWLEEALANGAIDVPRDAAPFWVARDAWTRASFLGAPPPEPDRKKAADAVQKELETGILSVTDAMAARGIDFDTHLETLEREAAQFEARGLIHPLKLAALKVQAAKNKGN
jgi:lambda family phage portal protein